MSLCRGRIVAFLLESRLYSLSERNDREILSAVAERDDDRLPLKKIGFMKYERQQSPSSVSTKYHCLNVPSPF